MSQLPEGWVEVPIADVADVNPRRDVNLNGEELVSFVPMASVDEVSGRITKSVDRPYVEVSKGFTYFRDGDVIFAKITPSMENGKSAVARDLTNGTGIGSTEFHVLRSRGAIDPDYLWRFVRQKSFRDAAQSAMSGAVGQQRVPANYLKAHPIPLAPLVEQRRIVSRLDQLTGATDRARNELARVPTLITRYKQRLLESALSGKLTKKWRTKNGIGSSEQRTVSIETPARFQMSGSSSWEFLTIGDVCKIEGGSQPAKSTFIYEPRPGYIRLIQIRDYKSDNHAVYIPRRLARRFASKTDIMIGRYGPPIFQILRGLEGAYNVALMKAVPVPQKISHDFLYWFLKSPTLLSYVEQDSKRTSGQDGVNRDHLEKFPVPLPTFEEQAEIVRCIELAFGWLDEVATNYGAACRLLARLDATILAKAFRGKLLRPNGRGVNE